METRFAFSTVARNARLASSAAMHQSRAIALRAADKGSPPGTPACRFHSQAESPDQGRYGRTMALQANAFAYQQYPANLRPRPTWKRQVMQMVIDLVIGRFPVASPTHGTIGGPGTPQETSAKPTICVQPSASNYLRQTICVPNRFHTRCDNSPPLPPQGGRQFCSEPGSAATGHSSEQGWSQGGLSVAALTQRVGGLVRGDRRTVEASETLFQKQKADLLAVGET
jgi:hypothetical protein